MMSIEDALTPPSALWRTLLRLRALCDDGVYEEDVLGREGEREAGWYCSDSEPEPEVVEGHLPSEVHAVGGAEPSKPAPMVVADSDSGGTLVGRIKARRT